MKAIVTLDDLDESQLPHAETYQVGWAGIWYEIDLTDANAELLWEKIRPYTEAGRRMQAAAPRQHGHPESGDEVPKAKGVHLYHAVGIPVRIYLRGLRTWADETGVTIETVRSTSGIVSYKYTAEHYRRYEAYLAEQDRQRMTG